MGSDRKCGRGPAMPERPIRRNPMAEAEVFGPITKPTRSCEFALVHYRCCQPLASLVFCREYRPSPDNHLAKFLPQNVYLVP